MHHFRRTHSVRPLIWVGNLFLSLSLPTPPPSVVNVIISEGCFCRCHSLPRSSTFPHRQGEQVTSPVAPLPPKRIFFLLKSISLLQISRMTTTTRVGLFPFEPSALIAAETQFSSPGGKGGGGEKGFMCMHKHGSGGFFVREQKGEGRRKEESTTVLHVQPTKFQWKC